MKSEKIIFIIICWVINIQLFSQQIFYVNQKGNDAYDGKSWDTALLSVKKAIDMAVSGDEIRIGRGTYMVNSTITIEKSLTIKGGYVSDESQNMQTKTVLNGNNEYRILLIRMPVTQDEVQVSIDGVVFMNAKSEDTKPGAAIQFYRANGILSNCVFNNNISLYSGGGAVAFIHTGTLNRIVNCEFNNNSAISGGAIYTGLRTNLEVINSTIVNNNCSTGEGGGIFINGQLQLFNNIIWGNKRMDSGDQIKGLAQITLNHNIVEGGVDDLMNINVGQEVVISENFIGNGAQVGGYDNLSQLTGSPTLSESDWEQMFTRVRFMRPGIVRIMGSQGGNYLIGGVYNPEKSKNILFKILDFCQAESITVIWGEWGHVGGTSIDMEWLNRSVSFLDYLVNTKKYSCVKYFTMVNEPNGSWSSVGGVFNLWRDLVLETYDLMAAKNLTDKIKLITPDVTLSSGAFIGVSPVTHPFVTNSVNALGDITEVFDYHLYPANDQVENDKFLNSVKAYKDLFPIGSEAIIGELGFKYLPNSPKGILNEQLKMADPYADVSACMMVYESIYGIDMSAAIIQLMMAGYKGALVWRLDDAMYMNYSSEGVKTNRWGFWNSLGAEAFGNAADEELRPWFYPVSLLMRFFPAGCDILKIDTPQISGLYGVASKKNGKYTIALINTSSTSKTFDLKMRGGRKLNDMKKFEYVSLERRTFTGSVDVNGFPVHKLTETIDFSLNKVHSITMQGSSFVLYTNME